MTNILVALGIIVFVIIDIIICLLVNYFPKMIGKRAKGRRIHKNMDEPCFYCSFRHSSKKNYPCSDCKDYNLYE